MKSLGDPAGGEAARDQDEAPPARPARTGRSGEGAGSVLEHLLRQERSPSLERRNGFARHEAGPLP